MAYRKKRGNINNHKENSEEFTISKLSKKINISRQTVFNCFAFLEDTEKIKTRQTDMAKIYL